MSGSWKLGETAGGPEDAPPEDMLRKMWEAHRHLQEVIPPKGRTPYDITNQADREKFFLEQSYSLADELHEAGNEISWKPWTTAEFFHRDAFVGELVDLWHFFMNLAMMAGVTPEEFFELYMEKNEINLKRHENGDYTGLNKCPGCNRALDDPKTRCSVNQTSGVVTCMGL